MLPHSGHLLHFHRADERGPACHRHGPYRWLRHPSYTGILFAYTGIGFFLDNWLAPLAILVGSSLGLAYRIQVEERALVGEMGDRYRDFAATRKRLIPYVW